MKNKSDFRPHDETPHKGAQASRGQSFRGLYTLPPAVSTIIPAHFMRGRRHTHAMQSRILRMKMKPLLDGGNEEERIFNYTVG